MYLRVYIWNSLICIHDPFVQFEWWKHCLNTAVDRRKFALDFCMETPSYYQSSQHRWIVTFKIYSYLSKQHWAKYLDKMVHCIVRYRCFCHVCHVLTRLQTRDWKAETHFWNFEWATNGKNVWFFKTNNSRYNEALDAGASLMGLWWFYFFRIRFNANTHLKESGRGNVENAELEIERERLL